MIPDISNGINNDNVKSYFVIAILIGVAAINFFIFLPFLQIIAIALVVAVVCYPIYNKILKFFNNKAGFSAFITTLFIVVIFVTVLIFIGVQVFQESISLYDHIVSIKDTGADSLSSRIVSYLYGVFPSLKHFPVDVNQYIEYFLDLTVKQLGALFSSLSNVILSIFLFFISLFYFLKDKDKFHNLISSFSPLSNDIDRKVIDSMVISINSVIGGSLVIAMIQGALVSIGLLIFGVPNVVLWGIVASIASLVPGLGTAIVIVPSVIYLALTNNMPHTIGLTLWGVLLVGLIDNFLAPKFLSQKTNVHPLVIFFSVIGGVSFFGPTGFILGPLFVSLMQVLIEIYISPKVSA